MKIRSAFLPLMLLALAPLLIIFAVLAIWQWRVAEEPSAAGYAGLGEQAEGLVQAQPDSMLAFPEDHGPHPDYRIEWWYLTANLEAEDGRPFGIQWTLFRQALAPGDALPAQTADSLWQSRQMWMAHAALSTPDDHRFAEKFARGMTLADGLPARRAQAGVRPVPFAAWIDDWSLEAGSDAAAFRHLMLRAAGEDFSYHLELVAEGPLVRHGEDGFSQKSADGQGSMYYSQPFLRVEGTIRVDGQPVSVSGRAWLDREWSSQLLGAGQRGWDWFSLHLDNGDKLMAFRLRGGGESNEDDYLSGSWISADGSIAPLKADELRLTPLKKRPVAGRSLPTTWQIAVPDRALDIHVHAVHPHQWMGTSFAYWEGMVSVEGSHTGTGYLEMTGY